MKKVNSKGFTLIELLIVIAIIAVIAGAVFVALNPLQRFQDTRDARRWSDVSNVLNAIKVNQVDNKGSYVFPVSSDSLVVAGNSYMISDATTSAGCSPAACGSLVSSDASCVNLHNLVASGYLGGLPVSPNGSGNWSETITGYVLTKTTAGSIKIQACEGENGDISVVR